MSKPSLGFLKREPQTSTPRKASKRQKLATWAIPTGIAIAVLVLLAVLFGEQLLPARSVQLETVATLAASERSPSPAPQPSPTKEISFQGAMLFQASGWIEAFPQTTKATALVSGVVKDVMVLQGELVEKGDLIATLIDDDAQLDLQTATAAVAAAKAKRNANVEAQKSQAASSRRLQHELNAANARLVYLEEQARSRSDLGSRAVSALQILEASQEVESQKANIAALQAQIEEAEAEANRLEQVSQELSALVTAAETELQRRQLALDRTRIVAPISGRISELFVVPGQQRMHGADDPHSADIAHLYDPQQLQARIDVPLAEASAIAIGQPVHLRTNFLPDQKFRGQVIRIDGRADLQRNTLQAKVRLLDNDPRLRPDMLCRAEFLATTAASNNPSLSSAQGPTRVRIFVPESALADQTGSQAHVWVVDASGKRIEKRRLELGGERRENYRLVITGLRAGDRVVTQPAADLQEGERIRQATAN
ncbi:efflux RND transporter periplasmic adaptor subunit [Pelagicoccus sp. NFK12]|uniref:Efflux RND transporter periplasmic adaptor subunit n=1 Tax=Pelagicoccus enzymogenes TaxID=2773457 RepID=A0A927IG45_9BACT|nr:efflux RND transporter periplasmic adaptor subunit [Pelagicoccus enzymogenes]MBD5777990.1 efflux RND transporter periplasmic adaptor subunit [Pelagicoccus enzymogenes]